MHDMVHMVHNLTPIPRQTNSRPKNQKRVDKVSALSLGPIQAMQAGSKIASERAAGAAVLKVMLPSTLPYPELRFILGCINKSRLRPISYLSERSSFTGRLRNYALDGMAIAG